MLALIFGVFGLIVGSFLNVFILRKGVRSISGRSSCMSCSKTIAWYDLVPVISWLVLAGKCRNCGVRISIQYPLVEATTGVLFALIGNWAATGFMMSLSHGDDISALMLLVVDLLAIVSILVAIAVYDFHHTIIPDTWAYCFAGLAFVSQLLSPLPADFPWIQFLLSGPIVAAPLFALWLVSRGAWMGLGDVKLALGIGWLIGFLPGLVAIMFSFVLGSIILVPLMLLTHILGVTGKGVRLTMKSEVPFGPFLIASCLIFWLLGLYGVSLILIERAFISVGSLS